MLLFLLLCVFCFLALFLSSSLCSQLFKTSMVPQMHNNNNNNSDRQTNSLATKPMVT